MTDSRKVFRVNVQGMIVEEIDERDDKNVDKAVPINNCFMGTDVVSNSVPLQRDSQDQGNQGITRRRT